MKNNNKKIGTYGTLKRGFRWNEYYGLEDFVGEDSIEADSLHSNGSYPALLEGKGKKFAIEIFSVGDNLFQSINSMECGSGYYNKIVKTDLGREVNVWFYKKEVFKSEGKHWKPIDAFIK